VYGSEIWGPDLINGLKNDLENKTLEEVQWVFLRMALWVGKSTPHACMLKETGRQLIACRVIQSTIGFWNRVVTLGENHLIAQVMKENMTFMDGGWSQNFEVMMQKLCGHPVQVVAANGNLIKVDKEHIMSCTRTKIQKSGNHHIERIATKVTAAIGSKVRACPDDIRDGFKAFKYKAWFQYDEIERPIIMHVQDISDIRTLARFRCGTHWLATEVARSNHVARSERICPCCNSGEREDELHVFFCDAYEHIKTSFPAMFNSDSYVELRNAYLNKNNDLDNRMNSFVNRDDKTYINELAGFLRRSIKIRKDLTNPQ
jgi:hypothetical protein